VMSIKKAACGLAVALAIAALAVFATQHPDRTFWLIGRILIVEDPPEHCDAIYLLGGDYETRAPKAAQMFREGWAPLIVLAREPEAAHSEGNFTDTTIGILHHAGVPTDRIVQIKVPGGVDSTADEARALRTYINSHRLHRLLVVTSAFHTRRARMALDRSLWGARVDLYMAPVEEPGYRSADWWLTSYGREQVKTEYEKLLYYFVTFWG
jgi:uncharacterized SAM-binding protein YcdF (DUF218 family)